MTCRKGMIIYMKKTVGRAVMIFWFCAILLFGVWGFILTALRSQHYNLSDSAALSITQWENSPEELATLSLPIIQHLPYEAALPYFHHIDAVIPPHLRLPGLLLISIAGELSSTA